MSNQSDKKLFNTFMAILIVTLLVVPTVLLHAWVITFLWAWFAVPLFHIQQISILQAAGLRILLGTLYPFYTDDNNKPKVLRMFVQTCIFPFFTLALGFFIHLLQG